MTRSHLVVLGLIWCCTTTAAHAQNASRETVDKAKAATVFIELSAGAESGSGTGFVVDVRGHRGLIATNEHVIRAPRGHRELTVVFNSGTPRRRQAVAKVIAADSERDLALLEVELDDLPEPLPIQPQPPFETQDVLVFGFPFGQALAVQTGNPAVTIGKGSVASMRHDGHGMLSVIQLDADVNPGNSGGPIVNASGEVVGVAVATVRGTQIGMSIPAYILGDMLRGMSMSPQYFENQRDVAAITLQVNMQLIDPNQHITAVSVMTLRSDKAPAYAGPASDTAWTLLSKDMTEHRTDIVNGQATGLVVLQCSGDEIFKEYMQIVVQGTGAAWVSRPHPIELNCGWGLATKARVAEKQRWIGGDDRPETFTDTPLPSGRDLARTTTRSGTVETTVLDLVANFVDIAWSADGAYLFAIEREGTIRKINAATWTEVSVLHVARPIDHVSIAGARLAAHIVALDQVWVFDMNLQIQNQLSTPDIRALCFDPTSGRLFMSCGQHNGYLFRSDEALREITKRYEISRARPAPLLRQHAASRLRRVPGDLEAITVVDEGGRLIGSFGGALVAYDMTGDQLVLEQIGPPLAPRHVVFSPDSRYVAVCDHNRRLPDYPNPGALIYAVDDLLSPAVSIRDVRGPIGIDPVSRKIFGQTRKKPLVVFSPNGVPEVEHDTVKRMSWSLLRVSPTGRIAVASGAGHTLAIGFR